MAYFFLQRTSAVDFLKVSETTRITKLKNMDVQTKIAKAKNGKETVVQPSFTATLFFQKSFSGTNLNQKQVRLQ